MKILIDGHMLGKNEGGNERYIKNLSLGLIKARSISDVIKIAVGADYFSNQKDFSEDDLLKIDFDNDFYRIFYFLPKIADLERFDVIHSTYVLPFFTKARSIVTVHDLSFKKHPGFYSLRERFIFNNLLPGSLRKAKAIIVPSHFTKKELVHFFPKYKEKALVVYENADQCFFHVNKKQAVKKIGKKYSIYDPFLLVINSKNPKKNIITVINAFKRIKSWWSDLKLVVIGGKDNIRADSLTDIYFLNNITDENLNLFYNACEIFLSSSIYEGFNLPILEALTTQSVVMGSSIVVNRELYGDSVIYFDPKNDREIASVIKKTVNNLGRIKNISQRNFDRIKSRFDWVKNSKKLLSIYRSALK